MKELCCREHIKASQDDLKKYHEEMTDSGWTDSEGEEIKCIGAHLRTWLKYHSSFSEMFISNPAYLVYTVDELSGILTGYDSSVTEGQRQCAKTIYESLNWDEENFNEVLERTYKKLIETGMKFSKAQRIVIDAFSGKWAVVFYEYVGFEGMYKAFEDIAGVEPEWTEDDFNEAEDNWAEEQRQKQSHSSKKADGEPHDSNDVHKNDSWQFQEQQEKARQKESGERFQSLLHTQTGKEMCIKILFGPDNAGSEERAMRWVEDMEKEDPVNVGRELWLQAQQLDVSVHEILSNIEEAIKRNGEQAQRTIRVMLKKIFEEQGEDDLISAIQDRIDRDTCQGISDSFTAEEYGKAIKSVYEDNDWDRLFRVLMNALRCESPSETVAYLQDYVE